MNLWSLLLPFKWFIIGVGEVVRGIYNLLRAIVIFVGSLFKYLYEGIIVVCQGIVFLGKDVIFKYLFLFIKWLISKIILIIISIFNVLKYIVKIVGKGLKIIFISLFKFIRFIFVGIFKLLKKIAKGLIIGIKAIAKFIYKVFAFIFKYLYLFIKTIFIYIYKAFAFIFKYLYLLIKTIFIYIFKGISYGIKYLLKAIAFILKYIFKIIIYVFKSLKFIPIYTFIGLGVVLKALFKGIALLIKGIFIGFKYTITYLVKTIAFIIKYLKIILKFIFVTVLFKSISIIFKGLIKGLILLLKLIGKIPMGLWQVVRFIGSILYKTFVYPFVSIHEYFTKFFGNRLKIYKEQIGGFGKSFVNLPNKIRDDFKKWIDNLSFIKDARNRREMKRQALLIDFDAADSARSEKKITYRYLAKNSDGKIEKGYLGAFSKLDVHSYLLAEGYEVYEIEPLKGWKTNISIRYKLKTSDLVFFLTQLSTYIKSGIPLVDSIKILGKQSRKAGVKNLYKALIYDLTMGDSFSEALEKQGSAFPRLLVNMIKSSELAGNLAETLDDMANYYTAISRTRKQMKSALTYPAVILTFATGVVVFILVFVIPSFVKMYQDADAQVPAITSFVINLSDFLSKNYILLIIGVISGIVLLIFLYKNVKVFRTIAQWFFMHTPILGKIIIYNEVAMFAKTFASLWNHNVFITSSMEILSKITNNEIYKMLIFDAITNVARGEPVSNSFKNHWAFPVVAYEMLVTGERTGQPGPMMDKVADFYQEEHANAVNQVKAFIEPALIIFLAFVVGGILLSVVIPMFGIYGQYTTTG